MNKLNFLTQWKSVGRRQPCCDFDDDQAVYKRRNRKVRRMVKMALHRISEAHSE